MKSTKIYGMKAAVLLTVMSVGLTSCKDEKEPEPEISSAPLMGKWYNTFNADGDLEPFKHDTCPPSHTDFPTQTYFFEIRTDGSFTYDNEHETINGDYTIIESSEGTFNIKSFNAIAPIYESVIENCDATLFKMQTSGSSAFDQVWVYHFYSYNILEHIVVHLYSGNILVKNLGGFRKIYEPGWL